MIARDASSKTTGEARLDGKQFVQIPCRINGSGQSSAILCSRGALRDGVALSRAANSRILAFEPDPIRRMPVQTTGISYPVAAGRTDD